MTNNNTTRPSAEECARELWRQSRTALYGEDRERDVAFLAGTVRRFQLATERAFVERAAALVESHAKDRYWWDGALEDVSRACPKIAAEILALAEQGEP